MVKPPSHAHWKNIVEAHKEGCSVDSDVKE